MARRPMGRQAWASSKADGFGQTATSGASARGAGRGTSDDDGMDEEYAGEDVMDRVLKGKAKSRGERGSSGGTTAGLQGGNKAQLPSDIDVGVGSPIAHDPTLAGSRTVASGGPIAVGSNQPKQVTQNALASNDPTFMGHAMGGRFRRVR